MMRLKWRDSATAVARPRIRVERFLGKKKHRVHLLADPQCHQVHYKHEENTVGCLAPDPCPKCGPSAGWKTRLEHYAPALVQDEKVKLWVPIVAVLTAGGYKDLAKCPAGAMRGRMLEISRLRKGPVNQMKIRELTRVDPIIPAFDPEPYVVALWWPELAEQLPPDGYVPDPIPYVDEPAPVVLQPEAKPISAEERARVRELFDKTRANGYSLTAPPAAVVEPAEMPPGRRPTTSCGSRPSSGRTA